MQQRIINAKMMLNLQTKANFFQGQVSPLFSENCNVKERLISQKKTVSNAIAFICTLIQSGASNCFPTSPNAPFYPQQQQKEQPTFFQKSSISKCLPLVLKLQLKPPCQTLPAACAQLATYITQLKTHISNLQQYICTQIQQFSIAKANITTIIHSLNQQYTSHSQHITSTIQLINTTIKDIPARIKGIYTKHTAIISRIKQENQIYKRRLEQTIEQLRCYRVQTNKEMEGYRWKMARLKEQSEAVVIQAEESKKQFKAFYEERMTNKLIEQEMLYQSALRSKDQERDILIGEWGERELIFKQNLLEKQQYIESLTQTINQYKENIQKFTQNIEKKQKTIVKLSQEILKFMQQQKQFEHNNTKFIKKLQQQKQQLQKKININNQQINFLKHNLEQTQKQCTKLTFKIQRNEKINKQLIETKQFQNKNLNKILASIKTKHQSEMNQMQQSYKNKEKDYKIQIQNSKNSLFEVTKTLNQSVKILQKKCTDYEIILLQNANEHELRIKAINNNHQEKMSYSAREHLIHIKNMENAHNLQLKTNEQQKNEEIRLSIVQNQTKMSNLKLLLNKQKQQLIQKNRQIQLLLKQSQLLLKKEISINKNIHKQHSQFIIELKQKFKKQKLILEQQLNKQSLEISIQMQQFQDEINRKEQSFKKQYNELKQRMEQQISILKQSNALTNISNHYESVIDKLKQQIMQMQIKYQEQKTKLQKQKVLTIEKLKQEYNIQRENIYKMQNKKIQDLNEKLQKILQQQIKIKNLDSVSSTNVNININTIIDQTILRLKKQLITISQQLKKALKHCSQLQLQIQKQLSERDIKVALERQQLQKLFENKHCTLIEQYTTLKKKAEDERNNFLQEMSAQYELLKKYHNQNYGALLQRYNSLETLFQERPSRTEDLSRIKELSDIRSKLDYELNNYHRKMETANQLVKYLNRELQNYKDNYKMFGPEQQDKQTHNSNNNRNNLHLDVHDNYVNLNSNHNSNTNSNTNNSYSFINGIKNNFTPANRNNNVSIQSLKRYTVGESEIMSNAETFIKLINRTKKQPFVQKVEKGYRKKTSFRKRKTLRVSTLGIQLSQQL